MDDTFQIVESKLRVLKLGYLIPISIPIQLLSHDHQDNSQHRDNRYGRIGPILQQDLDRLAGAGIPVDIVFEQGMQVLEAAH